MSNQAIRAAVESAERAETPYVLFVHDLALRLRLPEEFVHDVVRAGGLGPWLTVNGEPAVTRDSFKRHIRIRMGEEAGAAREILIAGPTMPGQGVE